MIAYAHMVKVFAGHGCRMGSMSCKPAEQLEWCLPGNEHVQCYVVCYWG